MPEYGKDNDDKKAEHTSEPVLGQTKEKPLPKTINDKENQQKSKNVEDDDAVMVQQTKESHVSDIVLSTNVAKTQKKESKADKVNNKRKRKTDSIDVVSNKDAVKTGLPSNKSLDDISLGDQTKSKELENIVDFSTIDDKSLLDNV
jgi:hypothetical protein